MALSSYAIITVDEAATMLADFGGIEGTRKTFYEDLINSASEEVEAYLNRKVISRTFTDERYSAYPEVKSDRFGRVYDVLPQELYLRNFPVTAVSAIKFDNVALTDITEGESTGIWWSANDLANIGKIIYEDGWPEGENNIKITYIAGYVIANVPAVIKRFCKELFLWHYSKSGIGSDVLINAVKSGTIAPGTGNFRTLEEIYAYFEKGLAPYRRHNG